RPAATTRYSSTLGSCSSFRKTSWKTSAKSRRNRKRKGRSLDHESRQLKGSSNNSSLGDPHAGGSSCSRHSGEVGILPHLPRRSLAGIYRILHRCAPRRPAGGVCFEPAQFAPQ